MDKYLEWSKVKARLAERKELPTFREGEVWWAAVGENMGIEINGKGHNFARPVYILKKYSKDGALVLPLTSQKKDGGMYVPVPVNGKINRVVLTQGRTVDARRLHEKIAELSNMYKNVISKRFVRMIEKNTPQA